MNLAIALQHKLYAFARSVLLGQSASGQAASATVRTASSLPRRSVVRSIANTQPAVHGSAGPGPSTSGYQRVRPALRVLRVVDHDQPAAAGRMVISGRMAEVCAELDRMAAREATA